ncbi:hypothetical protein D3C81_1762150 [compost metagenome]
MRQRRFDIGMKIERYGYADMRANNCTYLSGKICLRRGDALNHQSAVQQKRYDVYRARCCNVFQRLNNFCHETVITFCLERSTRKASGANAVSNVIASFIKRFRYTAQPVAG